MPKMTVRRRQRDAYESLENLIKTNGGQFKSESQAQFFGGPFRERLLPDGLFVTTIEACVPATEGQVVVEIHADQFQAETAEIQYHCAIVYLCDKQGIVSKTAYAREMLGTEILSEIRWVREGN